ncbi:hypothetical protein HYQ44_003607 [Verticillium longisporum]|nr:hypothetical protein HYQ44_003607 [Verticillium longisporum]
MHWDALGACRPAICLIPNGHRRLITGSLQHHEHLFPLSYSLHHQLSLSAVPRPPTGILHSTDARPRPLPSGHPITIVTAA